MKTQFYPFRFLLLLFFCTTAVTAGAQTTISLLGTSPGGGPATTGPVTTNQAVTMYTNATTAFTPAITATYRISNQQYANIEGNAGTPGTVFGATVSATVNSPAPGDPVYNLMNTFGGAVSNQFTACNTCAAGTGIDVTTHRAINLMAYTDALIDAAGNQPSTTGRFHYADLTITFNRPVSNPVLQLAGIGASTSYNVTTGGVQRFYTLGYSMDLDLLTTGVTLSRLSGSSNFVIAGGTSIRNNSTVKGASTAGAAVGGVTRFGASGSVAVIGTNITTLSFRLYLQGDGGLITLATGTTTPATNGNIVKYAFQSGFIPGGGSTALQGVAGDAILFGISLQAPVSVSGNVFNDPNGGNVNNSSGSANLVPSGMFANLVDASGRVVASSPVATDGTYTIPAIGEGSYTMSLSTTAGTQGATKPAEALPAGWANTGEFNGTPNTGRDPLVNGVSAVFTVAGTAVTNINFGIQRPPIAVNDNISGVTPGLPATVPNILANDTEYGGLTLNPDSITLIAPSGATGITTDAQGDVTGFTVPGQGSWSLNSTTGAVTFTPLGGFTGTPTPISYTVTDLAGAVSNVATISVTVNPPVTVSGTVFNDIDGGVPNGTPMAGVTVTLYAGNGTTVLGTTFTAANGTYSFANIVPGSYVVGVTTPAGYVNVASTDATPADGLTPITVSSTNVTGVNFGMQRPPTADPKSQIIPQPAGTTIPAGTFTQNVTGNDPEDGAMTNANPILITQLPANAVLRYNGAIVTLNQVITGFNPALLSVTTITNGATAITFNYAFRDATGVVGSSAAYSIAWLIPIPVKLESFTAHLDRCNSLTLRWRATDATNFDKFEIERSNDGITYTTLVAVAYDQYREHYTYSNTDLPAGKYFYRLRLLDRDSRFQYSPAIAVNINCSEKGIVAFPNPVRNNYTIRGLNGGELIQLYSITGQLLQTWQAASYQTDVDFSRYNNGSYLLNVINKHGEKIFQSKVIRSE